MTTNTDPKKTAVAGTITVESLLAVKAQIDDLVHAQADIVMEMIKIAGSAKIMTSEILGLTDVMITVEPRVAGELASRAQVLHKDDLP